MAKLRTDTNSYTFTIENVQAEPIVNANTTITIGGIVNSQADTERLRIKTVIRVPQSDVAALKAIYGSFAESLFYTPSRLLYDRTAIEEIQVVMIGSPKIPTRSYGDGAVQLWIEFNFEEVIET